MSRNEETSGPQEADQGFFAALLAGDVTALDRILADDFILVDVMRGGEIPKSPLIEAVRAGQAVFDAIAPADRRVRVYGTTAVINGRTRMTGRVGGVPFTVESRYTHVYVEQAGEWRLVAAQGTPIAGEPAS